MLYGMLAGLLKNRPLLLLKSVSNNNGLEAVRCLISTLQPNTRNRSLALLNNIMQWSQFSMKEALLGQVLKLEDAFREHDRIAGVDLPESIRMAVLSRCVTGQLRLHLQMQMTDTMSYGELRENILRWDRATVR